MQKFGFVHLSAGELLREERASGSKDGNLIDEYIKEGKIVPVEITIALLQKVLLILLYILSSFSLMQQSMTYIGLDLGGQMGDI